LANLRRKWNDSLGKLKGGRFKEVDVDVLLDPGTHQRHAKVVVDITESFHMDYFEEFVMGLQVEGTLDRVVYDEAHKSVWTEVIDHTSPNRKRCD